MRAHRWRRRIESGQARSVTDLAEQEGVTDAYVCRLLPLTCLAPDIVEAILDGRQPKGLKLAEVLGNGPLAWNVQRETWGFGNRRGPAQRDSVCQPSARAPPSTLSLSAVGNHQIFIDPARPPWVPSLEAFGRRPSVLLATSRPAGIRNPSQQRKSTELVEERLGVLQVGGVEALDEPAVDRGGQVVGLDPRQRRASEVAARSSSILAR